MLRSEPPLDPPELSYGEERAWERVCDDLEKEIREAPLEDEDFFVWLSDRPELLDDLVLRYMESSQGQSRLETRWRNSMEDDREYDPND
jgi:hypothetical protein